MEYTYSSPKAFIGQFVRCIGHRDNFFTGKIIMVETHYSRDHKAYHIYSIMNMDTYQKRVEATPRSRPYRINSEHLGDENILEILEKK